MTTQTVTAAPSAAPAASSVWAALSAAARRVGAAMTSDKPSMHGRPAL